MPFLIFLSDNSLCQEDRKYLSDAFFSEQHCFLDVEQSFLIPLIAHQISCFVICTSSQSVVLPEHISDRSYYLTSQDVEEHALPHATYVINMNHLVRKLYHDLGIFYREEALRMREKNASHGSVKTLLSKSTKCYKRFIEETQREIILPKTPNANHDKLIGTNKS